MTQSSPLHDLTADDQAFSFVFASGARPDQAGLAALFDGTGLEGLPASLSHVPGEAEGWVEILASGLTFDVRGLSPASGTACIVPRHDYGFAPGTVAQALGGRGGAISLGPAGHIAAGAALAPVIRTMAGLAANLAARLPVCAVLWPPARSAMEPGYFVRIVLNWLAGGAFPALGLTALEAAPDGSVASLGLAFFTGVEMQLEAGPDRDAAADFKLAIRVVDYLVTNGVPAGDAQIQVDNHALVLERSRQGKRVWVWRAD
ncbi:hypothetical protein MTR62_03115 [Novosphingobium sp. 1949]|uniref:DUF4261 domain-containing protein n=1 Tax=Novosphingobium organovorum TaxID=2930092 RepID=A0ABT0B9H6_9SPHN|nr:hypothetical protein [Novosphingobium organovorum]MCJ2181697.1 hypothetical protein [Novosphingobium organovorum]